MKELHGISIEELKANCRLLLFFEHPLIMVLSIQTGTRKGVSISEARASPSQ